MTNNETLKDLTTQISTDNIRSATRIMKRLAMSFALCFQIQFLEELKTNDREELWEDLQILEASALANKWDDKFNTFLENGSKNDATFALHAEMMAHTFEIVAITFAERIGGEDGYALLQYCERIMLQAHLQVRR
jgi:hypothetical protein